MDPHGSSTRTESRAPGPLDGIRVFDATLHLVGPWSSMLLGSLGAEVLHVEHPAVDWSQMSAGVPPYIHGTSIGYIAWNMNKRGVSIDFKDPDDLEFAYQLIETSDVFVWNMRPGIVDGLGLGYEKLKSINPRLVYCVATGHGRTGPRAKDRGGDQLIQALTGFWSAQGTRGGPGEAYRHYTQLDAISGTALAQGALLGLYARHRTGEGQLVEVSMLDASATLQTPRIAEHFAGVKHAPQGSSAFGTAPDRAFCCLDGRWLGVSVTSEPDWHHLCEALGEPDLATDHRFATNAARVEHRDDLEEVVGAAFAQRPRAYWELTLTKAGVPWGPPLSWEELRYHVQPLENRFLVEVETPVWGTLWAAGPPWQFSRTPARTVSAPIPGIDTFELKDELARDDAARA